MPTAFKLRATTANALARTRVIRFGCELGYSADGYGRSRPSSDAEEELPPRSVVLFFVIDHRTTGRMGL
jgi:hypothetical protein